MRTTVLRPEFSLSCLRQNIRPLAIGIFGLSLILPGMSAAASPDEELKALQQALATSENRQQNFTAQLEKLDSEIKTLKRKLVVAASNLTQLDEKLVQVEQRLDEIRQVENDTLADLESRKDDLSVTISALIHLSRQPEGTLIGNPSGLVDSLRASSLLQSILPKLKADADHLAGQLDTLAELRTQYAKEREDFSALRDERIAEQETLDLLLEEKRNAQSKIARESEQEQKRLEKLTSDVTDTSALITRLAEDRERQRAEEQARLEREIAAKEKAKAEKAAALAKAEIPKTEQQPQNKTVAPQVLANLSATRHITEAKGLLPLPVGGRIVTHYDENDDAGLKKGIVIETRPEATVISPFDGQIAFAGPFRHYGLLLIIDHGDGYHSLLAGMGSIDAAVGQLLLAGEPVGRMKTSSKGNPKLYMELRNNGSPIDPAPWLLAENRKVSG